jgi:pimeloyl-ACP methyl ester carboxylesterase
VVDDLRALLAAAGERGPYVLVAHSYGGLIALLYARLHPEEIAGLVMVDAASDFISQVAPAESLARWDASNRVSSPAAMQGEPVRRKHYINLLSRSASAPGDAVSIER